MSGETTTAAPEGQPTQGQESNQQAQNPTTLSGNWWAFALRGVVALILAVIAAFMPASAALGMTLVFGAYAFADGVLSLVSGVRNIRKGERWGGLVVSGLLGIAAGVATFLVPVVASVALVSFLWGMLAVWAIWTGVFQVVAAVRLRKEIKGEWLLGLSGLLTVLLGALVPVMLILNPAAGVLAFGLVMGAYALMAAILFFSLAWKLRKQQA